MGRRTDSSIQNTLQLSWLTQAPTACYVISCNSAGDTEEDTSVQSIIEERVTTACARIFHRYVHLDTKAMSEIARYRCLPLVTWYGFTRLRLERLGVSSYHNKHALTHSSYGEVVICQSRSLQQPRVYPAMKLCSIDEGF